MQSALLNTMWTHNLFKPTNALRANNGKPWKPEIALNRSSYTPWSQTTSDVPRFSFATKPILFDTVVGSMCYWYVIFRNGQDNISKWIITTTPYQSLQLGILTAHHRSVGHHCWPLDHEDTAIVHACLTNLFSHVVSIKMLKIRPHIDEHLSEGCDFFLKILLRTRLPAVLSRDKITLITASVVLHFSVCIFVGSLPRIVSYGDPKSFPQGHKTNCFDVFFYLIRLLNNFHVILNLGDHIPCNIFNIHDNILPTRRHTATVHWPGTTVQSKNPKCVMPISSSSILSIVLFVFWAIFIDLPLPITSKSLSRIASLDRTWSGFMYVMLIFPTSFFKAATASVVLHVSRSCQYSSMWVRPQ